MSLRGALLGLAGLVLACSPAGPSFPDWTIPVPEGVPVIEYAGVPMQERTEQIELVEDLAIGSDDPNYAFYQPWGTVVDAAGRIYVPDSGSRRIQVYDSAGGYLATLGGPGEGPGEFEGPSIVAIGPDRIVVHDSALHRLSIWSTRFEHLGEVRLDRFRIAESFPMPAIRTADASFVGARFVNHEDGTRTQVIERFAADGTIQFDYGELPESSSIDIGGVGFSNFSQNVTFVASPEGNVYFTTGDEYQIHACDASGEPTWALRVAWDRWQFTEQDKRALVEDLREYYPGLDASGTTWPAYYMSIARMGVDGHGHLYVFLYEPGPDDGGLPPALAVDVYAPSGLRLFAGTMRNLYWTASLGDFVYANDIDPETDERRVVRFRLIEPFSDGTQ